MIYFEIATVALAFVFGMLFGVFVERGHKVKRDSKGRFTK